MKLKIWKEASGNLARQSWDEKCQQCKNFPDLLAQVNKLGTFLAILISACFSLSLFLSRHTVFPSLSFVLRPHNWLLRGRDRIHCLSASSGHAWQSSPFSRGVKQRATRSRSWRTSRKSVCPHRHTPPSPGMWWCLPVLCLTTEPHSLINYLLEKQKEHIKGSISKLLYYVFPSVWPVPNQRDKNDKWSLHVFS